MNNITTAAQVATGARELVFPGVSFITFDPKAPNASGNANTDYFDVPDEMFMAGTMTGTKCAYEFFKHSHEQDDYGFIADVLAACSHHARTEYKDGPGRRAAAHGFIWTMESLLEKAFSAIDMDEFFKGQLKERENALAFEIKEKSEKLAETKRKNAEFIKAITARKQTA